MAELDYDGPESIAGLIMAKAAALSDTYDEFDEGIVRGLEIAALIARERARVWLEAADSIVDGCHDATEEYGACDECSNAATLLSARNPYRSIVPTREGDA